MALVPARQIRGTAQTVINTAVDIAAGNFSGSPAAEFDNTTDAAAPHAHYAAATLYIHDWGAAPVASTLVELWGVLKDVDGTDDDTDAPSGSTPNGARFFGAWVMTAGEPQRRTIVISLLGCVKVDFYIRNGTTQNMNNDNGTNTTVKIVPIAIGVDV